MRAKRCCVAIVKSNNYCRDGYMPMNDDDDENLRCVLIQRAMQEEEKVRSLRACEFVQFVD